MSRMNSSKRTIFSNLFPETITDVCEVLHEFNGDLNCWDQFNG